MSVRVSVRLRVRANPNRNLALGRTREAVGVWRDVTGAERSGVPAHHHDCGPLLRPDLRGSDVAAAREHLRRREHGGRRGPRHDERADQR